MYYKEFTMNEHEDNPNVLVIAGIHGNEIGTIKLAYDLIHRIENEHTTYAHINKLRILPVANFEGMRNGVRDQIYNANDLNRAWDTDRYDTRDVISKLIDDSDIIIDLHCSENCDSMFFLDAEMNHLSSIIDILNDCNVHYCVQSTYNDTLKRLADSKDKIGLTWEQRGLNYLDEDTNEKSLDILYHLLASVWRMLEESDEIKDYPKLAYQLMNNYEGLYIPTAELGQVVWKGDSVGYIVDMSSGKIIEELIVNENCRVVTQSYAQYVTHWYPLALVQPLEYQHD